MELVDEYIQKINNVGRDNLYDNYRYELYKVVEDGYLYTSGDMNRAMFLKDRDDREMSYMQYAGEESMRHCTDPKGEKWAYKEIRADKPDTRYKEKQRLVDEYISKVVIKHGIVHSKAFVELVADELVHDISLVEEWIEDHPAAVELLRYVPRAT